MVWMLFHCMFALFFHNGISLFLENCLACVSIRAQNRCRLGGMISLLSSCQYWNVHCFLTSQNLRSPRPIIAKVHWNNIQWHLWYGYCPQNNGQHVLDTNSSTNLPVIYVYIEMLQTHLSLEQMANILQTISWIIHLSRVKSLFFIQILEEFASLGSTISRYRCR